MKNNFASPFSILIICLFCLKLIAQDNNNNVSSFELKLPKLLVSNENKIIETVDDWENIRRPEILEQFKKYVYGRIPEAKINVDFSVSNINQNDECEDLIKKEVIVTFSNAEQSHTMNMLIFLPRSNNPVPLFLGLNFYGNHTIHPDTNISITQYHVNNKQEFCISGNRASHLSRGVRANRWPVERILERGYGLATIYYGDLDPDFDDNFQNGIHKLFYNTDDDSIASDGWGSISAWAYGLTTAMDYFELDDKIDQNRVVVIGHSRLGKTSLWAGALDERFAITISNNSGCGGAALSRRKSGETLAKINTRFPHWFCKNFHKYNDREEDLPIDQHMLIGLIAPRPVYVGSAVNDKWADPLGEYLSIFNAGTIYNLYNVEIFREQNLPELNKPRIKGKMGYHIRSGNHDLTKYDWEKYMDYADLQFSN